MKQPYRAILFDLDGTLLDTIDDLADSMNMVLSTLDLPVHPVSRYKLMVGDGINILARRVIHGAVDPGEEDSLAGTVMKAMNTEYAKRWNFKTRPYAGVPGMLSDLKKLGIQMTILSNKNENFTIEMVNRYFGSDCFRIVHGARPGKPLKPSPEVPLEIARELSIPPEQFLYLGDTATDMKTACSAGMYAIGASWGFRSRVELAENGAATIIDSPSEVMSVLRKTGG